MVSGCDYNETSNQQYERNETEVKEIQDSEFNIVYLDHNRDETKIKNFRELKTLLPQIVAVSIINLILLDLGMTLAFPTIAIPELLKSTEDLRVTKEQASWFGSIAFICQPLGSLLSGLLFEAVGRKKTMLYVNIPLFIGWLLLYFSTSVTYLYTGGVIMGIGIGLTDAPHITYLGEITQPKWRGILTSYAELCVALGFCFVYFLGAAVKWKTVSLISSAVPFLTIILLTRIPESPIWLLSKGRIKEAEKSLRWLRGWSKTQDIQEEFTRLIHHSNSTSKKETFTPTQVQGNKLHKKLSLCGLESIFQKSLFQPLLLVVIYFGFSHIAGVTSTRPFMVDILKEFGTPIDANWVTAVSSAIGIIGFITGMILLPKTGKRLISLWSMWGCALINILMCTYGFFFDQWRIPGIMVALFILLNFVWSFGIGQIPWMLLSEVFPFKGRGVASGVCAAFSYIFAFIFIKTYYSTYNSFTLPGVFGFYGVCTFFGGIFLYLFLPETEGKTLEEVETIVRNHFNNIFRNRRR